MARIKSKPKIIRESLGYSLREVGEAIDVDPTMLSRLENSKRKWTLTLALAWIEWAEDEVKTARDRGQKIPVSQFPSMDDLARMGVS